jgi:hypothetical protein
VSSNEEMLAELATDDTWRGDAHRARALLRFAWMQLRPAAMRLEEDRPHMEEDFLDLIPPLQVVHTQVDRLLEKYQDERD